MSIKARPETPTSDRVEAQRKRTALVEEAMRRATLEATTGSKEMRAGRFVPAPKPVKAAE